MKSIRKALVLLLSLVMAMTMTIGAFADDSAAADSTADFDNSTTYTDGIYNVDPNHETDLNMNKVRTTSPSFYCEKVEVVGGKAYAVIAVQTHKADPAEEANAKSSYMHFAVNYGEITNENKTDENAVSEENRYAAVKDPDKQAICRVKMPVKINEDMTFRAYGGGTATMKLWYSPYKLRVTLADDAKPDVTSGAFAAVTEAADALVKNPKAAKLKDGNYTVGAVGEGYFTAYAGNDDSTVSEAILTVKNGEQTLKFRTAGTGYTKVYVGSGNNAYWNPYRQVETELVSYTDKEGITSEQHFFSIPVSLAEGKNVIPVAAYSKKKAKWYEYHLTVTVPVQKPAAVKVKTYKTSIKSLKSKAKKTVTITWKKVSKCTGYQIKYSTKKSFKSSKTVIISSKKTYKKTIKKLKRHKKYYFKVRTVRKVSGKNYYSGWSKVKSVKVK